MPERNQVILQTGISVLAHRGFRGLTHRAVDQAAGLAEGSVSNRYRTREALVAAIASDVACRRLAAQHSRQAEGPSAADESLAWLELLLEAQRNTRVAAAIRPMRDSMVALLGESRTDGLALTDSQLAALLTGFEFAERVTGQQLTAIVGPLLESTAGHPRPEGE